MLASASDFIALLFLRARQRGLAVTYFCLLARADLREDECVADAFTTVPDLILTSAPPLANSRYRWLRLLGLSLSNRWHCAADLPDVTNGFGNAQDLMAAAGGYFARGCFRYFVGRSRKPDLAWSVPASGRGAGGRTRDRTLDLSRVKGTLSR